MTVFWTTWIIVLTLGNVLFALWLLSSTARKKHGDAAAGPETTGHTWDGDLAEYNNPLPRWWLGMFYLSIVFGLGYLVLYPGLGAYRGTLNWSQANQWAGEMSAARVSGDRIYARYAAMDASALQHDPQAMQTARHLFAVNCAQCHGADGHGARGFPNLSAANYQWGRDPDTVIQTITEGRQAAMPAWGEVLGDNGVRQVAEYVYTLSGRTGEPALAREGQALFATYCVACHGQDGRGTAALGAPNLTDTVWLYGGSVASIAETVTKGRQGQMPSQGSRLTPIQIRLLAAYVTGLAEESNGQQP